MRRSLARAGLEHRSDDIASIMAQHLARYHEVRHAYQQALALVPAYGGWSRAGPGSPAGGVPCRGDPLSWAGHPVAVPISRRAVTMAPPVPGRRFLTRRC